MDIFLSLIGFVFGVIAVSSALYSVTILQEKRQSERRLNAILTERQRIAEWLVLESARRLYHIDEQYIHKNNALFLLQDLLNVYHLGSCTDALRSRSVEPPTGDSEDTDD